MFSRISGRYFLTRAARVSTGKLAFFLWGTAGALASSGPGVFLVGVSVIENAAVSFFMVVVSSKLAK